MQVGTIFITNERRMHLQVRVCIHPNRLKEGRSTKDGMKKPKATEAEQDCNGFYLGVPVAAVDADVKIYRSL